MRIRDWSSDVCSSDLGERRRVAAGLSLAGLATELGLEPEKVAVERNREIVPRSTLAEVGIEHGDEIEIVHFVGGGDHARRSEEHTSELQSLMRISYAVFCLKKKKTEKIIKTQTHKTQTTRNNQHNKASITRLTVLDQ